MSLSHNQYRQHISSGRRTTGFTLIEMAIVLIILTLVVGGALVPLGTQIELRRRTETRKALDDIKEALIGYAVANSVLPCPSAVDSSNIPTGFALNACDSTNNFGYLPWATLGVTKQDAWGNLFHYGVSPNFTTSFTLTTTRSITIKSRDSTGNQINITNTNDIPAVIISHGANAYGAMSADGILQSTPSTFSTNNPDEYTNTTNNPAFFSRIPAPPGTAAAIGGEFDDLVAWISPNILYNRMVAAGKLP